MQISWTWTKCKCIIAPLTWVNDLLLIYYQSVLSQCDDILCSFRCSALFCLTYSLWSSLWKVLLSKNVWVFYMITEVWLAPPTEVFFFSDLLLQLPARSLEPLELLSLCTSLSECFWFQPAQGRHRDTNILSLPEYCMVLLTTSAPRYPTVIVRYGIKYQWVIF